MTSSAEVHKLRKLLRLARFYALEHTPYYARALVAFKHRLAYDIGVVVAYVPPFTAYWDVGQLKKLADGDKKDAVAKLAYGCVHFTCHFLRDHVERRGERHDKVWHLACDLEINDWVPDGLARPDEWGHIEPKRFGLPPGRTAEWYYTQLIGQDEGESESGTGSTGPGTPSGNGRDRAGQQLVKLQPFDRFGLPDTARDLDGRLLRGESHGTDRTTTSDQKPQNGQALKQQSIQQIVTQIRQTVAVQVVAYKGRGTLPLGVLRWAEEERSPVVRWQERLRRAVRGRLALGTEARIDYCFTRPHRKATAYEPFVLPSLAGKQIPRVVCVVDTSGSVTDQELGQAVAEVGSLLVQVAGPLVVVPCDAIAYDPIVVRSKRDVANLRGRLKGGGGTDMRVGLAAALELKPSPTLVVVLTDGHTPLPEHRPKDVDVLWVVWYHTDLGNEYLDEWSRRLIRPPWRRGDFVFVPIE